MYFILCFNTLRVPTNVVESRQSIPQHYFFIASEKYQRKILSV